MLVYVCFNTYFCFMIIPPDRDPMGEAIRDYLEQRPVKRLRVLSSLFDEDEMPVKTLFRTEAQMSRLERMALSACRGRVLDVGAGAGCHSLALQARGLEVTAVDVSPLSVESMRRRGVRDARLADFFTDEVGEGYDTLLLLMNGLGLVGRLGRLRDFFRRAACLLVSGGSIVADSSDLRYVFEDEDGNMDYDPADGYYGEVDFRMKYGDTEGLSFDWLYVDAGTLVRAAAEAGFRAEILYRGDHYDYLVRLVHYRP